MAELPSVSDVAASPNSVPRTVRSHGLCGSLKEALKFWAYGVLPLATRLLIVTTRGSAEEYLLDARSVRVGTPLFFAMTSTCASSDIVQARKSHACAAFALVAPIPMASPPTKVDSPPVSPVIGTTPILTPFCSMASSHTDGPGA